MFIDTTNKEGICKSLADMIEGCTASDIHHIFSSGDIEGQIKFLARQIEVDEVLFNHLTRRLIGSEQDTAYNLHSLLLTKNAFTDFLQEHEITFREIENGDINLYFKGKLCKLENEDLFEVKTLSYLGNRLHSNGEGIRDTCINGFCTAVGIKNDPTYGNNLSYCPEFLFGLKDIFSCFGCKDDYELMIKEYQNRSKYYCISYKIPIKECLIYECAMEGNQISGYNDFEEFKMNLFEDVIMAIRGKSTGGHCLSLSDDNADITQEKIYKIIALE